MTQGEVKVLARLQAENEKLKKQIELMKCCENCKNAKLEFSDNFCKFLIADYDDDKCKNYDKWELAE